MPDSRSNGTSLSATSPSLIQQVADRDPEAWRRLTELYGPLIFHWCRKQGLGEHDAADVLQDVFASVARAVDGFELRPGATFRGWLWTITRNQIRDWFRRRARQTQAAGGTAAWQQLADVAESLSDDPDEFTEPSEMNALFRRGLELVRCEFEERTWQIFWQAFLQTQPNSDVSEQFEITENAVRHAKLRVLRKLRREMNSK